MIYFTHYHTLPGNEKMPVIDNFSFSMMLPKDLTVRVVQKLNFVKLWSDFIKFYCFECKQLSSLQTTRDWLVGWLVGWLVVLGFNVISCRSVTHIWFLAFSQQY